MKQALYWEKTDDRIHCRLCPRSCHIAEGQAGLCRVRVNEGGTLVATTYGRVSSAHVDPIEKKPLYHFHPGSAILSLGSIGCNLNCLFCQNWGISQEMAPTNELMPADAVKTAQSVPANIGIAYTYNEPLIWYEYLLDTSRLVRQAGMNNVIVTNGEIEEEPLRELLPHIDAMNIDLKGMDADFYRNICRGSLDAVLRTIRIVHESCCHLELTNLLIPGHNDSKQQIQALVDFVASLSPEIPLHFSRYYPAYKMTEPPTPVETLMTAYKMAGEKLHYVYLGNVRDDATSDTYCPGCRRAVIRRHEMEVQQTSLIGANCKYCGRSINVVL